MEEEHERRFPAPAEQQAQEGRQRSDQVHRDCTSDRQGDVREEERKYADGGGARRDPGGQHRGSLLQDVEHEGVGGVHRNVAGRQPGADRQDATHIEVAVQHQRLRGQEAVQRGQGHDAASDGGGIRWGRGGDGGPCYRLYA